MEGEFEITIPLPGSKHHEVLIIDKYKDQYGLAMGQEGKDNQIWKKWTYPQVRKDSKNYPAEKAIPLKIVFGSWDDSVEIVKKLAEIFKVNLSAVECPKCGEVIKADDDQIPF